jgi:Icc-related predicted phosphoesterase
VRLYATCDLHGSDRCFRKFLNAADHYKADVILINGDITGKAIVPIVQDKKGTFVTEFLGGTEKAKNEKDLSKLQERISNVGYYPTVVTREELDVLEKDADKVTELFERLLIDRLREWVRLADEKLSGKPCKAFLMPGNDDIFAIDKIIEESKTLTNPAEKLVVLDGLYEMISTPWSNPTPWETPRECSEEELWVKIQALAQKVSNMSTAIFNFHVPPFDSTLDSAPKLDEQLRPTSGASGVLTEPVGSKSVRRAVEEYQPMLGFFGHIHESPGETKIGRTVCINPGSEYSTGLLRAFVIEIEDGAVARSFRVEG